MKFEYNTYKFRYTNKNKRVSVNSENYNCNSLFRYLVYLLHLITSHNLYFPYKINLLDYKLLDQYRINTNTYWTRMISTLEKLNIILPIKKANYSKKEATTYILNIEKLLEVFWLTYDKYIWLYKDVMNILSPILLTIIYSSPIINNNNLQNGIENLEWILRDRLYKKSEVDNPLNLKIYREITYLNNRGIKVTCRYHDHKGRQVFYPTANMKKEDRKEYLIEHNLNDEFDLHSAIFSVARLINKGEFDADWSIKDIFAQNNYYYTDGTILERNDFKKDDHLMYMLFFSDYAHYKKHKREQMLSEEMFNRIAKDAEVICGNYKKYSGSIFLYESLLELRIMHELVERNCDFANAYDCFYFNTNQITKDEVKQIINNVANRIANEFKGE